ncbi:LacI family DNA-binding transcriptional regulator [Tianweitania sp. BSSL-BM11]|uniref:LacI family DNA-binding transcriptional regulator n=1 Tax=Tianweitania aestuarii TaxID=2814886 RepID=A0ABS5RVR6_9HYPH|nr:LacI family DNA-binding transcriptional regulator [Tianweitania aestuarii]MBS9721161.1 LacI family DNA-binding transcriptional regulator [Tianweitania aestuarii]
MADIAAASHMSLATVDRVLNRRKGVSSRTIERVLKAAVELGYLNPEAHEQLAAPRPPNIVFLLPMGTNPYLRLLGEKVRAVADAHSRDQPPIRCFFIDSFDAKALAAGIRQHARWADGIAFMGIDHPLVREAIEEVGASGTRLVTIVSDLPHPARETYIGLDNQVAGRTAAYLLGRFCGGRKGSVALVAGSRTYRAHSERETGFLSLIEELQPGIEVIGMREGHDDRNENYQHALALIEQHPDLVGIYNVGGSSDGIARALTQKQKSGDIVFIGHGLTHDTRRLLIEGTMDAVINSDPDQVISATLAHFNGVAQASTRNHHLQHLKIELILRENIPLQYV